MALLRIKNISDGNRYAWTANDGLFPPGAVRDVPEGRMEQFESDRAKGRLHDFEETNEPLTDLPPAFRSESEAKRPNKKDRDVVAKLTIDERAKSKDENKPPPPPKPKA